MARGPHNLIAVNMTTIFSNQLRSRPKRFFVYNSNQKIFLPRFNYGLYPDALVVCEKPIYWDDNQLLLINPILIVEILSKSTKNYDRREKFAEYKTLESFKEYVLIEQDECRVESRFREEPNLWRETVAENMADSIYFPSIDCRVALSDVYENIEFPPPTVRPVRKK